MTLESMLPTGSFEAHPDFEEIDRMEIERYSSFLLKSEEPSLWKERSNLHAYAFRLVIRFELLSAGPLLIRLSIQDNGTGIATIKVWERVYVGTDIGDNNGSGEERLINSYTKTIDKPYVDQFIAQVDKARFWELASSIPVIGADGVTWNIEGVRAGDFHFVTRWCPGNKDFVDIGFILTRICESSRWEKIISEIGLC